MTRLIQMVIGADVSHAMYGSFFIVFPSPPLTLPSIRPGSLAPSVAAIVGSMDWKATIFGNAITVQPCSYSSFLPTFLDQLTRSSPSARLEIIGNLMAMILKLLAQFTHKHSKPPERLIFIRFVFLLSSFHSRSHAFTSRRDGISEGQFAQVIAAEVKAIRMAAQRFGEKHNKSYTPFVVLIPFPSSRADLLSSSSELTFITCGKVGYSSSLH
jgi:hypothetical protein